jgi:RimJ/RimL family protein N-acetyltransferase
VTNVPAIRVAEGAGFEREGLIRRDYKTATGELVDLLYFGKLA